MNFKNQNVVFLIIILFTIMGSKLYVSDQTKTSLTSFQKKQKELDKLYSDKKLGSFIENGRTYFRLFAPNAEKVSLLTFESPEQTKGKEFQMIRDENGVWET